MKFDIDKILEQYKNPNEIFSDNLSTHGDSLEETLENKAQGQLFAVGLYEELNSFLELNGIGDIVLAGGATGANAGQVDPLDPFGPGATVEGYRNGPAAGARAGTESGNGSDPNAIVVWNFFTQEHKFSAEVTAGIMGNLAVESPGFNPTRHQGGGGPGRGILQWTNTGRWQTLLAWAKSKGLDPLALRTQLEFCIKEMYKSPISGKNVYQNIRTLNIRQAMEYFEKHMEAAGKPHFSRRLKEAEKYYKRFS